MPTNLVSMTEKELQRLMQDLAKRVNSGLSAATGDKKPLFCLLVFDNAERSQYISTCTRETMIRALRASAYRLEARDITERVPFDRGASP